MLDPDMTFDLILIISNSNNLKPVWLFRLEASSGPQRLQKLETALDH